MPPTRELLRAALELAATAPSPHNTQPWRVDQEGASLIIRADPSRLLRHTDPSRRDAGIALGGFAEALRIALAASGVPSEVTAQIPGERVEVKLESGALIDDAKALASLLRQRQTSRLAYSPRALEEKQLEEFRASLKPFELELQLFSRGTSEHAKLLEWLFAASRESWMDVRASVELGEWLRLDFEGVRAPQDGLSSDALCISLPEALALKGLANPGPWKLLETAFLAPLLAEQLAKSEVKLAEQSPAIGILIAREHAQAAGAGVLRAWLELTRRNFALHPISVLLDRRGWELARHVKLDVRRLALAFRLGHSAPPPRSGRRAVEQFARLSGS